MLFLYCVLEKKEKNRWNVCRWGFGIFFLEIKRIRLYMYYYSVLLYKDLISLFKMYSRYVFHFQDTCCIFLLFLKLIHPQRCAGAHL